MSKTVKYYLLLRDPFPILGKDGKRSRTYEWTVWEEGFSLDRIRKHKNQVEGKTKILKETTTTEAVK